jgi:LemA protein
MMVVLVAVLALLVVAAVGVIVSHNRFVRQRNVVDEAWRQVDVELQRRHDLVPNLVEAASTSARFEQATLEQVVRARSHAVMAQGLDARGQAEKQLSGALAGFLGVAEAHPELRSSQNFLHLQQELTETEDRIAAGRRYYNATVRTYNTRIDTIPSGLVAGVFRFTPAEYFEVDDPDVRAVPPVAR